MKIVDTLRTSFSSLIRVSPIFALALAACATSTWDPDSAISTAPPAATAPPSARSSAPIFTQESEMGVPVPEDTPSQEESQSVTPSPGMPFDDIWQRIRAGFQLDNRKHPYIERELRQFAAYPHYLRLVQRRAEPFLFLILQEVESRRMPTELALLPAVESAFYPQAYSPNHAVGIWQFIPSTGRQFGLTQNWWYDGRRDVLASTRAALDYLQQLHRRFDGDWELALAAYNAGQGSLNKAIRNNKRRGKPTDYWSLNLSLETRLYIPRLLALRRIIAKPDDYGITLQPIANRRRLAIVEADSQLDLALAAELAGISTDLLYRLNPGFNRWATAPEGPHRLLIPRNKAEGFHDRLAQLDSRRRMPRTRYRIKPGDSLSAIAQKHALTVAYLKKINNLHGSRIRAGGYLIIPSRTAPDNPLPLSVASYPRKNLDSQPRGTPVSYTVRPGDTLWDIGRAFKVDYLKLAKWNDLTPGATLRPKRKLVIWKKTGH